MQLNKIVKKYFKYFGSYQNYLLLMLPYKPYRQMKHGYAFVDAFYIASNTAYLKARELAREINGKMANNINLKQIFEKAHLGERAESDLISVGKFGTSVTLQAIELDYEPNIFSSNLGKQKFCNKCMKCFTCCPNNVYKDRDFKNCIRSLMNETASESDKIKIGTRLFGCGICVRCCPLNSKKCVKMPSELERELTFEKIEENIKNNNFDVYKKFLGSNYARKSVFKKHFENMDIK